MPSLLLTITALHEIGLDSDRCEQIKAINWRHIENLKESLLKPLLDSTSEVASDSGEANFFCQHIERFQFLFRECPKVLGCRLPYRLHALNSASVRALVRFKISAKPLKDLAFRVTIDTAVAESDKVSANTIVGAHVLISTVGELSKIGSVNPGFERVGALKPIVWPTRLQLNGQKLPKTTQKYSRNKSVKTCRSLTFSAVFFPN